MDWSQPPAVVDAFLDACRRERDALGDAAARELIASGALKGAGGDLVGALEQTKGPAARELLEVSRAVPSWVDFSRMRAGAELGLRTPMQSALALIFGSLLESYGSALGAKVLVRGGMLTKHVLQRLRDTTTFVLEVAASKGPQPGSFAHRHVLRTRLVHAFVRHGMDKRGDWRPEWGEPINQEDYASTLLVFCHVYLRSLARLGFTPTVEEEDSVHHLYRWVGHLMGVRGELLTTTRADEQALYGHITRRQLHPDDDSRTLARSLVAALAGRRPVFLPEGALLALSRQLLGDALVDQLGLSPASARWGPVTAALPLLSRAQRTVERLGLTRPPLERLGERVSRLMYSHGFALEV